MDKFKESFPFSAAAPIAICGVPFDNISTSQTIRMIEQMVNSRKPHYLATANVDFLVQAMQDVELRRILFDAHLVLCDGTPLVWASRLLGNPLPERVAGSDLVPLLLRVAEEKGYRPFFLGATPEAMEQAVQNVQAKHPQLEMAGYYSPPFSHLLDMNHDEIRSRIIRSRADLLFVGFGCPKQEKWISMHYQALGVPVSVGIGGTIDFLAGRLSRAPLWMQKSGTEWIYRLSQEPRRLLGRYTKDLWYFGRAIAGQYIRLKRRKSKPSLQRRDVPPQSAVEHKLIKIPARLDIEAVYEHREASEKVVAEGKPCVLDVSEVHFIDSTGVGLLIRLQKRSRLLGQQLILLCPSENIQRALQMMKLDDFFVSVDTWASAQRCLEEVNRCSDVQMVNSAASALPALAWRGELTAANAEEVWLRTLDHLGARVLVQRKLTIDLAGLTFIDSTGLSIMIRAKKHAARQGLTVDFAHPQPNVLNVIRLSRLEPFLLIQ